MVNGSRYPWEEHYIAAVLETDDAKLPERVRKAHAAIASRRQELNSDHLGTPDEQRALRDAQKGLSVLSRERIGESSSGSRKESSDSGNQPAG